MEWHIIGILAAVVIYNLYRYYHEDNNNDYSSAPDDVSSYNKVEETSMEETISTKQLALKTIEKIGSEPKFTEEGRIQFEYQGITFLMETADDCMFVNLIWPWCHSFSKLMRMVLFLCFMELLILTTWQYMSRRISCLFSRYLA